MATTDLFGLLEHIGLERIRSRGEEVWASCPYHHDSGDSWSINKDSGLHSCFSCGAKGNLEGLVRDIADVDNWTALALIRQYGLTVRSVEEIEQQRQEPHTAPAPFVPKVALERFVDPPAEALRARNISAESAARFEVRWNPKRDSWICPIKMPSGKLLGWQDKGASVRNRPVGVPKSETVFGAEHLNSCKTVILVESPLDVVYLHEYGFEPPDYTPVASFGASVSNRQMHTCAMYSDEILLALDNDEAGRKNTARLLDHRGENWGSHHRVTVLDYEGLKCKDIGEMHPEDMVFAVNNPLSARHWRWERYRK